MRTDDCSVFDNLRGLMRMILDCFGLARRPSAPQGWKPTCLAPRSSAQILNSIQATSQNIDKHEICSRRNERAARCLCLPKSTTAMALVVGFDLGFEFFGPPPCAVPDEHFKMRDDDPTKHSSDCEVY